MHLKASERWIAFVRLGALPFVVAFVWIASGYPSGYERSAWITTVAFAVGSLACLALTSSRVTVSHEFAFRVAAQAFDTVVISSFMVVFAFESGTSVQQLLYVAVVAACVRFEILGGLAVVAASIPLLAIFAKLRADRFNTEYEWQLIILQTGIELVMALIVGGLVLKLAATTAATIDAYVAERRMVEELRRLSALRADFVSLVSHELRSPLAAVIGSARTLQRRWRELSAEHRDSFLALIADETNRLSSLVSDVFDTSRIDAGTFGYSFSELDVATLVGDAVATAAASQDEVDVVARVSGSLPVIRGDGARLRQVLANLLENAVKYSPAGGTVEVDATTHDGHVLVDVTDHGSGIPPEHQNLIFEKFGRVRGPDAMPGTGLGLYIARAIAEAHGGALAVTSEPGEGATFTLTLPVPT